ncbi:MAG: lactonase family protein [Cystobacterineae bacterium]|nr:lactonase family protein [Cystobacterineae bacterium]
MRRQTLLPVFAASLLCLLSACGDNNTPKCQPDEVLQGGACISSVQAPCVPEENGQERQAACGQEGLVYAACFLTGEVATLSSKGATPMVKSVGDHPQALSGMGEFLLCTDDSARQLLRLDAQTLKPLGKAVDTGATPIHVSVSRDERYVYVINAGDNSLQVVDGPTWQTQAELPFGPNTSPQAFAMMGNCGYVPLYGNLGNGQTAPGQRLVRINLSKPTSPSLQGEADFSSLDLHPYSTEYPSVPLPYDVVVHKGALYVALNNLYNAGNGFFSPAGPGAIAKVDPQTLNTEVLFLGDECLNVASLVSNGEVLLASCMGDWGVPGTAGVALLKDDKVQKIWPAPADFSPGALAVQCDELWVANAGGGDVYVFSIGGQSLELLWGVGGTKGGPMEACPKSLSGYATVQSLWSKP